jgi:hypothetical protein
MKLAYLYKAVGCVFFGLVGLLPTSVVAGGFGIEGTSGFTSSTGDVNDQLTGPGFGFGGRLLVPISGRFSIFGGGHLSFFGGQDYQGQSITDGALSFDLETGGEVFLLGETSDVRPFLAVAGGWGRLGWSYSDYATSVLLTDSDSIGFLFAAPEAGIDFGLGENLFLRVGGRYLFTRYSDETREHFVWDFNDGNFLELFGGIVVQL